MKPLLIPIGVLLAWCVAPQPLPAAASADQAKSNHKAKNTASTKPKGKSNTDTTAPAKKSPSSTSSNSTTSGPGKSPTDSAATGTKSTTANSAKPTTGNAQSKATTSPPAKVNAPTQDDDAEGGNNGLKAAAVSSMSVTELSEFETYPATVQALIQKALVLTQQNLRYQFGSADPKAQGMDCSGTIYYLLQQHGIKGVPRQSDEICRWVMGQGVLYRTENAQQLKDATFSALKPGDLLFWTGTYETSTPRELPISHVMMYLGKRKKDGKAVVFGASDGRSYDGQRRNGVSVFDFSLPRPGSKASFYGYGRIPGLK